MHPRFYISVVYKAVVADSNKVQVLSAIRAIRILRVLKLSRYSPGMRLVIEAILAASSAFQILFFFLFISIIVFSSFLYYAESFFCAQIPASNVPCSTFS